MAVFSCLFLSRWTDYPASTQVFFLFLHLFHNRSYGHK